MSGPQVGGLRPEYTLWEKQVVTYVLTREYRVSNDLLDVKVKIKNWSRDEAILAKFDHIWDFLVDVISWLGSSHARSCSKISICVRSTQIMQWNQGRYCTYVWDQLWYCTLGILLNSHAVHSYLISRTPRCDDATGKSAGASCKGLVDNWGPQAVVRIIR